MILTIGPVQSMVHHLHMFAGFSVVTAQTHGPKFNKVALPHLTLDLNFESFQLGPYLYTYIQAPTSCFKLTD